jgi:phosphopantothenoylcysteine decarboxylase/phosphopantothenate--cysteine ligase
MKTSTKNPPRGPRIVLGVTGSIGAYKAAELLRLLQKAGAEVRVAMTRHAAEFVTPLTMQTLSGFPVAMEMFDLGRGSDIEHIELVRDTDLLLVAPATADIIGKFAAGVADDFLSTFYTAVKCPVLIAPAMNTRMWTSGAMTENLARLAGRGVAFVDPGIGALACGDEGEGRLADPALIAVQALALARRGRSLEGLRVLVTAGPTREAIDPVRFVSNRSSGRMGYAVASALARRGAAVTLVSGPTELPPPYGVERVEVETAAQMADAVLPRLARCDALWMAAAVADFRPGTIAARKLAKSAGPPQIRWVATQDILAEAGRRKRQGQILVGFAAETGDPSASAKAKLRAKNLDFVVANDVTAPGAGFDVPTNAVTLFSRNGSPVRLSLASKGEIAERLVTLVHGDEPGTARAAGQGAKAGATGRKTTDRGARAPPAGRGATAGGAQARGRKRRGAASRGGGGAARARRNRG